MQIVAGGIPVSAFHRASEQYDALFREFRLIVERDPRSTQALPARLLALIDELGTRFAGFSRGADAQWRQALERGEPTVDLEFTLPREVGPACERYDRLLDEADGYCRTAELITLPASAESVALRKWFLLEFPAQVAGRPPTRGPRAPGPGACVPKAARAGRAEPRGGHRRHRAMIRTWRDGHPDGRRTRGWCAGSSCSPEPALRATTPA